MYSDILPQTFDRSHLPVFLHKLDRSLTFSVTYGKVPYIMDK
ncbi:hypothetical protein QUB70_10640 [Microcoleus sp. A003_D6]